MNGIIDTGSERSYLNTETFEQIQEYGTSDLHQDDTAKRGVLLANNTACKTLGGADFILQIGSVAGQQYLSVMEGLSHSIILGMDFALQFGIEIDCVNAHWKFKDSSEVYPFEIMERKDDKTLCQILSESQRKEFEEFLRFEMEKFAAIPNQGLIDLVRHEIILKPGAEPVRVRPYRRSAVVSAELNKQIDELLKKG